MPLPIERPPTYQEYPKWKHHREGKSRLVKDREEELRLGEGWGDSPAGPFGLKEGDPFQWFDEWGLESLDPAARNRIREALTDADADVHESGADIGSQVRRASMKKIFSVFCAEYFNAGLLTESMLTDTIPRMVYDAAVSGRWQTGMVEKNGGYTEQYGHYWVSYDVPTMLEELFAPEFRRWRGRRGRGSETSPQTGPEVQGPSASNPARNANKGARRNSIYEDIDEALREISGASPKSHEEVFRFLESRKIRLPNREPFKAAGGWLKGFQQNEHTARAWLSQAWGRLKLPPFARGRKK